jgi:uncharacterized protein
VLRPASSRPRRWSRERARAPADGRLSAEEPRQPRRPPLWGLGEPLLGIAGGLLLSALAVAIADAVTGYNPSSHAPTPVAVTAAGVGGLWVGLVAAVEFASRTRGTSNLAADFGWRIGAWWDIPLGAAVGVFSQYVLVPLVYLPFETVDRSIPHQLSQPARQQTAAAHGSVAVVVVFVFLAVGAPLVEELFFRGLLLRSLLATTRAPIAIVVSALAFALAHFEALQFAGLAVFGLVLALLAWRTRRLAPSIAAHMAFNAVAVVTVLHNG